MAYALKVQLSQDEAGEVGRYISSINGTEILIDNRVRVEIVKGDVKERNDKATMIMRYRHIEGF